MASSENFLGKVFGNVGLRGIGCRPREFPLWSWRTDRLPAVDAKLCAPTIGLAAVWAGRLKPRAALLAEKGLIAVLSLALWTSH